MIPSFQGTIPGFQGAIPVIKKRGKFEPGKEIPKIEPKFRGSIYDPLKVLLLLVNFWSGLCCCF